MVDITRQIDLKGNQIYSDFNVSKVYTVATLPTAAQGAVRGARACVSDATTPTYAATLTGSGAVVVPVFYNGTAWVSA